MKTIRRKWHRWFAIPLALALALGIALPMQLGHDSAKVYASNVAVTGTTLTGQDIPGQFTYVQFDISWEYSWRDTINYDAVWVFVKYRVDGGDWAHATLSTTSGDHVLPTDNSTPVPAVPIIDAVSDGKGVFMYRTAGTGPIDWTGVQLKWMYGTDLVADAALVEGKVFAIEMVYIPQGAFWVGDADNSTMDSFRAGGTTGPLLITSEDALLVGDDAATKIYYDNVGSNGGDQSGPIPADFPKGYDAFYSMKYEVSHREYAEFLNTLTWTQEKARFESGVFLVFRNVLKLVGSVHGADASGDDVINQSTDGEWIAMNHLSWTDGAAYADWAGLRPMTELESEKICRGTQAVADDEFPWGTTTIVQATNATNWSTDSEAPTPANSNANYGNAPSVGGPLRVGSFTDADDTREEAGSTYYGVMDMAGNLYERTVTVGSARGRDFTGIHGDGALDASGEADVGATWPDNTSAAGAGFRLGSWDNVVDTLRTSDRTFGALANAGRSGGYGFRGVRTAPPAP